MPAPVQLYSLAACPFAQRTRILLRLKEIPFELTEIDFSKPKPDWFLKLNPLGQVPVIVHEGKAINESSVIGEYLEDVFPERRTMPADPWRRAIARILIGICNDSFVPEMYRLLLEQDPSKWREKTESALASWRRVNDLLLRYNPEGTWLFDEEGFGAAELTFAGFFQRYCLNAYYRHFELPQTEAYARVRRWADAILAHPLVCETGACEEDLIKLYADYARGYRSGQLPPGQERSAMDLSWPLAERPMPPRPAPPPAA